VIVVDPVCGLELEESEAVGSVDHLGDLYSFCSIACLYRFEHNSARFARPTAWQNAADQSQET